MTQKNQRVLLVDDYPDALEIWSLYLEMLGYTVMTADDGRKAVEMAVTSRPHLIVMDLELPGLTGFEAARQIRAHPDTHAIPLIAATGYSHAHQIEEAQRAGFDLIVIKPCDPETLANHIGRLLDTESFEHGRQPDATFKEASSERS
ncbi:MAG: response regulator [Vicinamibacterales bacterium]